MAEQALYRKYRSATFAEVIGQDHVVRTLTAALKNGRLSHAYLFTGPRGTGKTSVARLLARALNCLATGDSERPCGQCESCRTAMNSSLDLVEIDAASNNSVDDVRELRDKIGLAPTSGRYKVYIIDEVHMLSSGAFNALLKTLEEPPAHAVFILATTEAHKLPDTIISRTQRFSFRPIGEGELTAALARMAKNEGVEVQPEALALMAAAARGGFRDAIGMLDQVASGGVRPVTAAAVRDLLGMPEPAALNAINQAVAGGDARAAIGALTVALDRGVQPGQLAAALAAQWRAAMLAAAGAAPPPSTDPATAALSQALPPALLGANMEAFLAVTRSAWPREALEVAVVRLAASSAPTATTPAAVPTPAAGVPGAIPTAAKLNAVAKPTGAVAHTSVSAAAGAAADSTAIPIPTPTAAKSPESPEPTEAPAAAASSAPDPSLWPKVLANLRRSNNSLSALLQMYPTEFTDAGVTVKPKFNFHRDLFLKPQNRRIIEEAAKKVYGRPIAVHAKIDTAAAAAEPKPPANPDAELVASALDILGGELISG